MTNLNVCVYNKAMINSKVTIDNLRDMGGLSVAEGRVIKCGKIYRTSAPTAKKALDKHFLDGLNLDVMIDFRATVEKDGEPSYVPTGVEYVHAPVLTETRGNAIALTKSARLKLLKATPEELITLTDALAKSYFEMPFSQAYKALFDRMDEGKTIMFNCTAGKDRTGIAALLIELAFGRSVEQAKVEYMLSNQFREKTNKKAAKLLRFLRARDCVFDACMYALTNHEENFENAISTINEKFGTISAFLEKCHGITPSRVENWKKFYLD